MSDNEFVARKGLVTPKNITVSGSSDLSGSITFHESITTPEYMSGFAGHGTRLESDNAGKWGLDLDNLTVRGRMKIYELIINQLRATNGSVWISSTGKVESVQESSRAYSLDKHSDASYYFPLDRLGEDLYNATWLDSTGGSIVQGGFFDAVLSFPTNTNTQQVRYSGISTGGRVTISMWARSTNTTQNMMLWSLPTPNLNLYFTGNLLCLNTGDGADTWFANSNRSSYCDGEWHLFTVVIDFISSSNYSKLYIDGTFIGNATQTGDSSASKDPAVSNAIFTIGNYAAVKSYGWRGDIGPSAIFNKALDSDDIQKIYNSYFVVESNEETPQSDINSGLVAHYTFDEDSLTVATDYSNNNNNGTLASGVTKTTGKIGKHAISYSGTASPVLQAGHTKAIDFDYNDSFSTSGWLKINQVSAFADRNAGFMSIGDGWQGSMGVGWRGGSTPNFYIGARNAENPDENISVGSTMAYSPNTLSTGEWYHVVMNYDGTEKLISLYVNGELDTTLNISSYYTSFKNQDPLFFGSRSPIGGNIPSSLDIDMDDLRIYNRKLTLEEINTLYTQNSILKYPSDGLIGLWNFNDANTSTAFDYSGNQHHLDLLGTPVIEDAKTGKKLITTNCLGKVDSSGLLIGKDKLTFSVIFTNTQDNGEAAACVLHKPTTTGVDSIGQSQLWMGTYANGLYASLNSGIEGGPTWEKLSYNQRYTLTLTYDGTTAKVYLDGDLRNSYNVPGFVWTDTDLRVGASSDLGKYTNIGSIEEVRIYDRALSPEEVLALYEIQNGIIINTSEDSNHGFIEGDLIRAQRFTGNAVYRSDGVVTWVDSLNRFRFEPLNLVNPTLEMPRKDYEYVRIGNIFDQTRQGAVYLTADDNHAPYIDVIDEVNSHDSFNTAGKIKTRMGKLSGITSNNFGTLSGYGFWASGSAYLEGGINATSGKIADLNISSDKIYTGTGTFGNVNTPFYLSSSGNFSLKSALQWNGSTLVIDGTITSSAGLIGGWSISESSINKGNTTTSALDFPRIYMHSGDTVFDNSVYKSNETTFKGFGIQWHAPSNAGLIQVGELPVNSTGNFINTDTDFTTGWYGIIAGRYNSDDPYFQLSFNTKSQGISTKNVIAGWNFDWEKLSKGNIELNSSTQSIKLGTGLTSLTTGTGSFFSGSGEFALNYNTSNYIRRTGSTLSIASNVFDLISGTTLKISNATSGLITLGGTTYAAAKIAFSGSGVGKIGNINIDGNTNSFIRSGTHTIDATSKGFFISGSGDFNFSADNKNFVRLNNNKVQILSENFFAGSSTSYLSASNGNVKLSGSNVQVITPSFYFGSANQYISGSGGQIKISGSNLQILSNNTFLGSNTSYLSASNGIVKLSGSNVSILTPNFYLGSTTNYISGSDDKLELRTNDFILKGGSTLEIESANGGLIALGGTDYASSKIGFLGTGKGKIGNININGVSGALTSGQAFVDTFNADSIDTDLWSVNGANSSLSVNGAYRLVNDNVVDSWELAIVSKKSFSRSNSPVFIFDVKILMQSDTVTPADGTGSYPRFMVSATDTVSATSYTQGKHNVYFANTDIRIYEENTLRQVSGTMDIVTDNSVGDTFRVIIKPRNPGGFDLTIYRNGDFSNPIHSSTKEENGTSNSNGANLRPAIFALAGVQTFEVISVMAYDSTTVGAFDLKSGGGLGLISKSGNNLLFNRDGLSFSTQNTTLDISGNLIATNANLSGKITANDGLIAGWDINANKLFNSTDNEYIGLHSSSDSNIIDFFEDSGALSNFTLAGANQTSIVSGKLHVRNAADVNAWNHSANITAPLYRRRSPKVIFEFEILTSGKNVMIGFSNNPGYTSYSSPVGKVYFDSSNINYYEGGASFPGTGLTSAVNDTFKVEITALAAGGQYVEIYKNGATSPSATKTFGSSTEEILYPVIAVYQHTSTIAISKITVYKSTIPFITIGNLSDKITSTTNRGIFMESTGDVLFKAGSTPDKDYLKFSSNGLELNTDNFSIDDSGNVTVVGSVTVTGGNASTRDYVQSRGQNLVTNGTGLMGDNTNFSGFTFNPVDTPEGAGSFNFFEDENTRTRFSDEPIPINPESSYYFKLWAKSEIISNDPRYYIGYVPFDVQGLQISPSYHLSFSGATYTTLAADLNVNDTTITLVDATGWQNAGGATGAHQRSIRFYPYIDSNGYEYDDMEGSGYSRRVWSNVWDDGGISGNVITLRAPWSGIAYPAGTKVMNATSGGTYVYNVVGKEPLSTDWKVYTGVALSGSYVPGTKAIKWLFLSNYKENTSVPDARGRLHIAGLEISEMVEVNKIGSTIISGGKIITDLLTASNIKAGVLESINYNTVSGSSFDLATGTFKLGGSSSPKLSWNGSALEIDGKITATTGEIGGWNIHDGMLSSSIVQLGILKYNNAPHDEHGFKIDSNNYFIYSDGTRYANTSYPGFRIGNGSEYLKWDGSTSTLTFKATNTSLDANGNLTASNAVLSGSIYADSGYFSGSIYATSGYFSGSIYATSGYFDGEIQSATGNIGGWSIGTGFISSSGVILNTINETYETTSDIPDNTLYMGPLSGSTQRNILVAKSTDGNQIYLFNDGSTSSLVGQSGSALLFRLTTSDSLTSEIAGMKFNNSEFYIESGNDKIFKMGDIPISPVVVNTQDVVNITSSVSTTIDYFGNLFSVLNNRSSSTYTFGISGDIDLDGISTTIGTPIGSVLYEWNTLEAGYYRITFSYNFPGYTTTNGGTSATRYYISCGGDTKYDNARTPTLTWDQTGTIDTGWVYYNGTDKPFIYAEAIASYTGAGYYQGFNITNVRIYGKNNIPRTSIGAGEFQIYDNGGLNLMEFLTDSKKIHTDQLKIGNFTFSIVNNYDASERLIQRKLELRDSNDTLLDSWSHS